MDQIFFLSRVNYCCQFLEHLSSELILKFKNIYTPGFQERSSDNVPMLLREWIKWSQSPPVSLGNVKVSSDPSGRNFKSMVNTDTRPEWMKKSRVGCLNCLYQWLIENLLSVFQLYIK
jgi:hypothetical protein